MPKIGFREHQYATAAAIALLGLILLALTVFAPTAPAPAGRHYSGGYLCWTEPKTGTGLPAERLCGNPVHMPADAVDISSAV